ncbi:MAG: hypothetical protein SFU86_13940 [Pirellulaceae bacterium]|nr:hypothetical protein [Pirellulaceae bacterium]
MSSLATSLVVFCCIFGSAVVGLLLRSRLPKEHLGAETKDVVTLVTGVVGAMTGIVLGLLVASANASFDSQRDGVAQLAANIVVLDRALAHYGPETREIRGQLQSSVRDLIERMWADEHSSAAQDDPQTGGTGQYEQVYDLVLALHPQTDPQRTTQAQALKLLHETAEMRWLLFSQRGNSIPRVFLILIVAWLAITFASFGLFAPRHATSLAVLILGSLVVSSAVFLILELQHPFGGLIHISSQPLQTALLQIGK